MNNKQFSLAQAFIEAEKRDYEKIDASQIWITSEKFNRSMNSLIKKENNLFWKYINSPHKKVAVIILAFMLLSSCAMGVEAIRTPVVRFITEIYESFTKIFLDDVLENSTHEYIDQKMSPSFIIDGYEKTLEQSDILSYQIRWINKNNDEIIFQQNLLTNYNSIIDTEKNHYEYIVIDHGEAIYFKSYDKHSLIWNNESYTFKIVCPLSVKIDDLIRIANSVK